LPHCGLMLRAVQCRVCCAQHGFHLGHLRLGFGKSHFYEFDSRVPFLVRGPGIQPNSTITVPGINVDLAPTWIDIAGGIVPPGMDGMSMKSVLLQTNETAAVISATSRESRPDVLIEYTGLSTWPKGPKPWNSVTDKRSKRVNDSPNNTFRGLRIFDGSPYSLNSNNLAFVEYTTSDDWNYDRPYHHELYDMDKDPYQLANLYHNTSGNVLARLQARLEKQWMCSGGAECQM
jgi:N-acetylglucosamine-6-sulfatase